MLDLDSIWEDAAHRNFAESLNSRQAAALRDLLLVTGFADDVLTPQERAEIAGALAEVPGLSGTLDFGPDDLRDHIDALYARNEEDSDAVLTEISKGLKNLATRKRAFALALALMQSDDFAQPEERFALQIAAAFDLDDQTVEEALAQASGVE